MIFSRYFSHEFFDDPISGHIFFRQSQLELQLVETETFSTLMSLNGLTAAHHLGGLLVTSRSTSPSASFGHKLQPTLSG